MSIGSVRWCGSAVGFACLLRDGDVISSSAPSSLSRPDGWLSRYGDTFLWATHGPKSAVTSISLPGGGSIAFGGFLTRDIENTLSVREPDRQ
jgi:hypothetical protein